MILVELKYVLYKRQTTNLIVGYSYFLKFSTFYLKYSTGVFVRTRLFLSLSHSISFNPPTPGPPSHVLSHSSNYLG
jgi:hypothetical protein